MFAILYGVIVGIGYLLGYSGFTFYILIIGIAVLLIFIQFMIGPKTVEWSMRIRYVKENEYPKLHQMVGELADKAGLSKKLRVGISKLQIPNAFAFGRSLKDGRVCVTQGIIKLLSESELKAVLGHEISHLKNRDVLTITLLSVIPILLYRLAWHFLFFGSYGRRGRQQQNTVLIGLAAFIFYFITNLLVLYASRIREYFADRGSVALGNKPNELASALYKLVYGSARMNKESLKETEGLKAFFVNDPSRALNEIKELSQLDLDKSGAIDAGELSALQNKSINLKFGDRMLELLSTHPNMLKRIKHLSSLPG